MMLCIPTFAAAAPARTARSHDAAARHLLLAVLRRSRLAGRGRSAACLLCRRRVRKLRCVKPVPAEHHKGTEHLNRQSGSMFADEITLPANPLICQLTVMSQTSSAKQHLISGGGPALVAHALAPRIFFGGGRQRRRRRLHIARRPSAAAAARRARRQQRLPAAPHLHGTHS